MVTLKFKYGKFLGRLDLTSKFTFVQGRSGTGKTTIIDIMEMPRAKVVVSDGYEYHYLRGLGEYPIEVLPAFLHNSCKSGKGVFIADEEDFGRASRDLQRVLKDSPYLSLLIGLRGRVFPMMLILLKRYVIENYLMVGIFTI